MPIKKRFILMAAGVLGVGLPPVAWASAPGRAGVNPTCQNIPAQYAGKKPPYAFNDRAAVAAGKQVYDSECSTCHGRQGRGDGPAATMVNPKPASFADKAFMEGQPVDCDFYRISEGVQGTAMRPWKWLGEDKIWKVLIYERSFSGVH